jgi:CubicO group peptidase (beta-lactamase class C family)
MKELLGQRGWRSFQPSFIIISILLWGCAAKLEPPQLPEDQAPGDYSYLKSYVTDLIQAEMKKYKLAGLSIAVVDDQGTMWSEGFGYAEKSTKREADANTVYRVGSISKLFTATAIMQLVEQGLLDIDDPISTYLSEFSIQSRFPDMREPTVRDLLTHHSGLPADRLKDFAWESPPPKGYDEVFLELPGMLADDYMARPPGTAFAYCNLGFSLLGNIVAAVSGESYPDYIENHILDPLEMDHSAVTVSDKVKDLFAMGYSRGKATETPYIRDLAAGSILSSANDMAKFAKMIIAEGSAGEKQILKPETLELMFEPQNEGIPLDLDYRIGLAYWLINPMDIAPERSPASHAGDLPPYHAILLTLPGEKLAVTVLSNSNESSLAVLKVAQEALVLAYEIKTGKSRLQKEASPVVPYDEQQLASLGGQYASPMGLASVKVKGKRVLVRMMGLNLDLIQHANHWLSVQLRLFGLISLKIGALDAIKFKLENIEQRQFLALYMEGVFLGLAEKFDTVHIPEVWINRTGKYEDVDGVKSPATSDFELAYDAKTGLLLLKLKFLSSRMAFPLKPLSDSESITIGTGRNLGETVRIESRDGKEYLHFSGFTLKHSP